MSLAQSAVRPHASKSWSRGKRTLDGDLVIAQRMLAARKEAGLSQEKAAESLNITFQQLQKYERGANRISCGKLAIFAKRVGKPIAWFFEGLTDAKSIRAGDDLSAKFFGCGQSARIARAVINIKDSEKLRLIAEIAEAMERSI